MTVTRLLPALFLLLAALGPAPLARACPQQRGDLFEEAVSVLSESFHDEDYREDTLPEVAARYREAAHATRTLEEERQVIHEFLSEIPASHLAIYSAQSRDRMTRELMNKDSATFGFQILELDDDFYVGSVYEGGPAFRSGLLRGDKILAIDEQPVRDCPLLDWRTDDAHLPDPPKHALLAEDGLRITLLLEREPGLTLGLRITARPYSSWRASRASARVIARHGRRLGYVHFWYFHFRGMESLLGQLAEHVFEDCDAFILDMRGRGGSATAVQSLLVYLKSSPPFSERPLAVLVDEQSRSAKEVFAYEFKEQDLGLLVGQHTAGAVIPATFRDLGEDTVLMYPAFDLGQYTEALEGHGVEPDVAVVDRIPYSRGGDPILEAGVRALLAELGAEPPRRGGGGVEGKPTDLERFRKQHDYRDRESWMWMDVFPSVVTETRRRIYFNKDSVTRGLMRHARQHEDGRSGFEADAVPYPEGSVFVAESLDENGEPLDTEVLIVREEGPPEFRLFDRAGSRTDTFSRPDDGPEGPEAGNVPQVCLACHTSDRSFEPMSAYPAEPEERILVLDPRYRNVEIATHFLESYHQGNHVFGPYASIWLSKIQADLEEADVKDADREYLKKLRKFYRDYLQRGP